VRFIVKTAPDIFKMVVDLQYLFFPVPKPYHREQIALAEHQDAVNISM